jgi:hypothetical protein
VYADPDQGKTLNQIFDDNKVAENFCTNCIVQDTFMPNYLSFGCVFS